MRIGEAVTYIVDTYGWQAFEHLKDYDDEAAYVVRAARARVPVKHVKHGKHRKPVPKNRITDPVQIRCMLFQMEERGLSVEEQAELTQYSIPWIYRKRRELGIATQRYNCRNAIECTNLEAGTTIVFRTPADADRRFGWQPMTTMRALYRGQGHAVIGIYEFRAGKE